MKGILVALISLGIGVGAAAQTPIGDLTVEVESGRVRIDSLAGNGGSSGPAITGYLMNETAKELRINVHLSRPLYLVNRGASQNMVATAVYLDRGRYRTDGRNFYIPLRPNFGNAVTFIAYCADFDKDNPSASDTFTVGSLPKVLLPVMANIRKYAMANPKAEITVSAQAAVWLAQGRGISEIRERFPVTPAEENLARSFLRK